MRFNDPTQNLNARLRAIYVLILVMFVVLGGRLYSLQIVRGDYYAERARHQRLRVLPLCAPRGAILDREGRLLVNSRPTYSIVISREELSRDKFDALIGPLAGGLNLEPEYLRKRFDESRRLPAYETIILKESATRADIAWLEARAFQFPALGIEERPQRQYPANGLLAHVLGYVGEIGPTRLEQPQY